MRSAYETIMDGLSAAVDIAKGNIPPEAQATPAAITLPPEAVPHDPTAAMREATTLAELSRDYWCVVGRRMRFADLEQWAYTVPEEEVKRLTRAAAAGGIIVVQRRDADCLRLLARLPRQPPTQRQTLPAGKLVSFPRKGRTLRA